MIKNAKKFINTKVYEAATEKYLGRVSDVAFSPSGEIKGYYVLGDSIVPLLNMVFPSSVTAYKKGRLFVSSISHPSVDFITFKKNIFRRNVLCDDQKIGAMRDMLFDFETGEIEGFLYSENILKRSSYLDINKIKINGKNITVEN